MKKQIVITLTENIGADKNMRWTAELYGKVDDKKTDKLEIVPLSLNAALNIINEHFAPKVIKWMEQIL